jgi:hypothetical protein
VLAGYISKIRGIPAQRRTNRRNVDKNCKISSKKESIKKLYAGFCGLI